MTLSDNRLTFIKYVNNYENRIATTMHSAEFEGLVLKRKDFIRSLNDNEFDFDEILAGLYNDASHFIYEILQNAEDAKAKRILFNLQEDRLEVYHDGKEFSFQDIKAITGIGISTKKDDINAIGKFGVGFKSVFAITSSPYIYSGNYNIKIEDFVVPSNCSTNSHESDTQIILPFNHKLRTKAEIFDLVSKKLENLEPKSLLFLKNIEEVQWKTPVQKGHYLKSTEYVEGYQKIRKVSVISATNSEEYLVFEKPVTIDTKELKVEVAYKSSTNNGREIIVKEADSKLVVFFPTDKTTYLNFLIQAPYRTTPNRENIPLDDEKNQTLIETTAELVADSIPIIKRLGYLDVNFLNVLPIDTKPIDINPIYAVIYKKVREKLSSEEDLLPTNNGNFTKATDALLARGKELTELLNQDDINILFSKRNWMTPQITSDRNRELRDYLINQLSINEIGFEDFATNITSEFLDTKSNEWFIDFYRRLPDQKALWREGSNYLRAGILRSKPIIRLEDSSLSVPFHADGNPAVYLPTNTNSNYPTVHRSLAQNEESLRFLKELGLAEPNILSEINEFVLPKYQNGNAPITLQEYLQDFQKFLIAFKETTIDRKERFITKIKSCPFVRAFNPVSNEVRYLKPSGSIGMNIPII